MSNEKLQFQDEVKRFLVSFPAMFPKLNAYADEVGKVGSLEQAAADAQGKIDKAKKDYDAQIADLEKKRENYLKETEKAQHAAVEARAEVDTIIADAHQEGERIIAQARAKADAHVAYAAQAVKTQQDTFAALNAQIAAAKTELVEARNTVSSARDALAEIAGKKKQLQDSLDDLKARL